MKFIILLISLLLTSQLAVALPIHVDLSQQQLITTDGQLFNFSFPGLLNDGIGKHGQFSVVLNGDYSGANSESSVINLDVALGLLDLGNGLLPNGIITNTVMGLTLNSYSRTIYESDDIQHSWVFDISDGLLNTMLADKVLTVRVKNDPGVNALSKLNPDFVRVGFNFDFFVPEPTTSILLVLGLLGLVARRRLVV